jgi:hypothetical protein
VEFVINDRGQAVEHAAVSVGPSLQQLAHLSRR